MKPVPIHTAAINGIPVRFFASPFPEEPDFPWVAYADLTLAARVERGFRQHYKSALKRDWKDGWKIVDTADGPGVVTLTDVLQRLFPADAAA